MKQTKFAKALALSTGVLIFSVSASCLIFAWTPPSSTPPDPNAAAPINVSGTAQGKLGNLGIGTTSPTERLELSSGSKIKFTDNGVIKSMDDNHALLFRRSENKMELREYGDIVFSPGAISGAETAKMILNSNGNLGIGTTNPGTKLHIANGTLKIETAANSWNWIEINRGGADTIYYGSDNDARGIWSNGTRDVGIYTNGANRLMINGNSGNVGIGTTTPGAKLDINGNTIARGELQSTMGSGLAQLRMVAGNYGAMFRNDGDNTYFLLTNSSDQYGSWNGLRPLYINNSTGNVSVGTKLCLGGVCCSTWEECMGGGGPFIPVGGCTATLPAGNKKIFVTSTTYDDHAVHAANQTNTMANADNACQTRAAAAGLSGTYKALIYETVLYGTSLCGSTTVLRRPYDVLPSAALWNGEKIGATTNCEWHLVATDPNDMFSVDASGNYLQNPIQFNELGQPTSTQVFT